MFPTRKRIVHLHIKGQVILTTADHSLYVDGKGWINAGDVPAAKIEEQKIVHNLGEQAMPINPIGFVAGTPILTSTGFKPIEDIKPGDMIQVQPDDDQGDDKPDAHEDGHAGDTSRWWERN